MLGAIPEVIMSSGTNEAAIDLLRPEMSRFVGRVAATARLFAPKRTGELAASIYSKVNIDGTGEVGVRARHARWVQQGTGIYGPHHTPIVPVRSRFLRFQGSSGRMVYARSVRGQRPNDFLSRAMSVETRRGF
jgi:hypothetical protein